MIMPGSPRISGEAFAIERLRENPELDYAALRRLAEEAGVAMQPILYGRARRHLELPPLRLAKVEATPPRHQAANTASDVVLGPVDHDGADHDGADHDVDAPTATPPGDLPGHPKKKGSAAFEFLVGELRREPGLSYGELRRRAEARDFPIAPIMYGRAKAVLGLVPVRPRGAKKAEAAATAARNAAPRTLKQVESVAADRFAQKLEEVRNLDQLVAAVKDLDAERRRLRSLLERIVAMIDEALG